MAVHLGAASEAIAKAIVEARSAIELLDKQRLPQRHEEISARLRAHLEQLYALGKSMMHDKSLVVRMLSDNSKDSPKVIIPPKIHGVGQH